jgi:hypothetical protein
MNTKIAQLEEGYKQVTTILDYYRDLIKPLQKEKTALQKKLHIYKKREKEKKL